MLKTLGDLYAAGIARTVYIDSSGVSHREPYYGYRQERIILTDGSQWGEKPSRNGSGWYAGNIYNPDALLYERIKSGATQ